MPSAHNGTSACNTVHDARSSDRERAAMTCSARPLTDDDQAVPKLARAPRAVRTGPCLAARCEAGTLARSAAPPQVLAAGRYELDVSRKLKVRLRA